MGSSANQMRIRISLVFVLFVGFFGFVALRLIQLQVLVNPTLNLLAKKQFEVVGKKSRYRLPILDRSGEELAVSVPAGSVFARPRMIARKRETARKLAKLLGGAAKHWYEKLKTDKPFVWVQRQLSAELTNKIDGENIPGIFVQPENRRVYPNESLAANTIGFTDIDGTGLSGLERALNEDLLSKQSQYQMIRDGKGTPSYIDKGYAKSVTDGAGIISTLDRRLQNAVEEEIDAAMASSGAKSVMAVVMDPYTGEIYALGQRPTFDPNQPRKSPAANYNNRVLSYLYEPGSTMKTFFAAMAIEKGMLKASTPLDCGNGEIHIGGKRIREAETKERFAMLPLEKVIRFSSNVGAVRIVQRLGVEGTRQTLDRFGFSTRTGIELPGEASSAAKPLEFFTPFAMATASFGQGIAVTPLQVVRAFASIANGGYLVRPHILRSEKNSLRDEDRESQRVLSPQTVDVMKRILVGVTEEKGGTGVGAQIPGIHVAGKTGTAQKYEPGLGYGAGKYFSSFVGFLPAERPEFVIGVMVDEPKTDYYAAKVAVPLFKKIAVRSLQIMDRIPQRTLAAVDQRETTAILPASASHPIQSNPEGQKVMPDLMGVSMRDTLRVLGSFSTNIKIVGSGYVSEQEPKAGALVNNQTPIRLNFSPQG